MVTKSYKMFFKVDKICVVVSMTEFVRSEDEVMDKFDDITVEVIFRAVVLFLVTPVIPCVIIFPWEFPVCSTTMSLMVLYTSYPTAKPKYSGIIYTRWYTAAGNGSGILSFLKIYFRIIWLDFRAYHPIKVLSKWTTFYYAVPLRHPKEVPNII